MHCIFVHRLNALGLFAKLYCPFSQTTNSIEYHPTRSNLRIFNQVFSIDQEQSIFHLMLWFVYSCSGKHHISIYFMDTCPAIIKKYYGKLSRGIVKTLHFLVNIIFLWFLFALRFSYWTWEFSILGSRQAMPARWGQVPQFLDTQRLRSGSFIER